MSDTDALAYMAFLLCLAPLLAVAGWAIFSGRRELDKPIDED